MARKRDIDGICEDLKALPSEGRVILAVVGPPGAGKSTTADAIAARLNAEEPGSAAVFPMDGYHYDDLLLVPRGLRPRKGSPDTFDTAGFAHMLMRLRDNREEEIAVPVFDREIEIARAGARMIARSVRYIIAEGNYLLLDLPRWRDLKAQFDLTVRIDVPEEELLRRLGERWKDLSGEELRFKLEENDLPNGRLVIEKSAEPDIILA